MATFAPNTESLLAELDERERHAWWSYKDALADLTGRAYGNAEPEAWTLLETQLRDIEAERAELEAAAPR